MGTKSNIAGIANALTKSRDKMQICRQALQESEAISLNMFHAAPKLVSLAASKQGRKSDTPSDEILGRKSDQLVDHF